MENEIISAGMPDDAITLVQLPVITERLHEIKPIIEERISTALSMAASAESIKEKKQLRADLNKESTEMEERRMAVKAAIEKPYKEFETVYKDCILDVYRRADDALKRSIQDDTKAVTDGREENTRSYFDEYLMTLDHIPEGFVRYEDAHVPVGLSVTEKKMREHVKSFLDLINSDVATIKMLDNSEKYLAEYSKTYNFEKAVETIALRERLEKEASERLAKANEAMQAAREAVIAQNKTNVFVHTVSAPTLEAIEEPKEEKTYTTQFLVVGTMEQLKKLKEFLENGGYDYESI